MKKYVFITVTLVLAFPMFLQGRHMIYDKNIKSLQAVVNRNWMSPPVMMLNSTNEVLNVSFDELSHNFHRYVYRLEHCEADWSVSEDIFESDWLEGFNDITIEDYENSLNTTVLYTHYRFHIPNEQCRLKISGNYRLRVLDEDKDGQEVLKVEFCVVEKKMDVGLSMTTNTDAGLNSRYQQLAMTVNYNSVSVTNPDQIYTFVMQNWQEADGKRNVAPNFITNRGLKWEHNRDLIFEAGNEYHKFEVLSLDHPTMGIERMAWDGQSFQAYPFVDNPRRNYVYDEDANGAFYIRNSDNIENDRICDYVFVNYKLQPANYYNNADVFIEGKWTSEATGYYRMTYDETTRSYNGCVLQKQGYYNYRYLMRDLDGQVHIVPEEGCFFETENSYQALVYYKGQTDRTWRILGYQEIKTRK